jgi:hemolysin III
MGKAAQRRGEEVANSVSHGVAFAAAIAAIPILVVYASKHGTAANIVGGAVFGSTMALLYLASTLYHAVPPGQTKAKQLLRRLDHGAIFLLIAGTYTPFTLGVLGGPWGWSLFGVIWGIAVLGVLVKLIGGPRYPKVSSLMYVAMGWMVLVAIRPLMENVPGWGLGLLLLGGLAYTGGVFFYLAEKIPYAHFIWHLFVMAGTTFHFFAVLFYSS